VTSPRGHNQALVCVFRISRQPWTWISNVMGILFMTASLGFSTYLIELTAVGDRGGVNLTLLLTVVAFKLLLSDNLPKVSYLTYLDWYVLISFGAIFLISVESMGVAFMIGIKDTPSCAQVALLADGVGDVLPSSLLVFCRRLCPVLTRWPHFFRR
jgi:hypothetical protein